MLLTAYRYFDGKIGSQISRNGKASLSSYQEHSPRKLLSFAYLWQDQLNAYTSFRNPKRQRRGAQRKRLAEELSLLADEDKGGI